MFGMLYSSQATRWTGHHGCVPGVSVESQYCVWKAPSWFLTFRSLFHLYFHFSPTSRAPEVCLPCLDFLVPSGPHKVMCMKIAVPSVLPQSIRPTWKTRSCAKSTTWALTRSVPTWTWTYGLAQQIAVQTSPWPETPATAGTCEGLSSEQCE